MPPYLLLAYRNVVRQRRRSLFAVLVVAFGVVALLLATGFIEWNVSFGREAAIRSQFGHIQVVRPGYFDDGLADPFSYLLPAKGNQLAAIAGQAHVRILAPRLSFNGLISLGDETIPFIGEGVDPGSERFFDEAVTITAGRGLADNDALGIIVGQGLAANLGLSVGDDVVLTTGTASGGMNGTDAKVRGLFATITKAYDDTALRVPLALAQKLSRTQGVHAWVLLLDETENTQDVLATLRQKYAGSLLQFVPWTDLADFYNKTAALLAKQVDVIKIVIATIIVLSISNTRMMSVFERTGEIGTALALGTGRGEILRMFLAEGCLLGALGSAGGVACGYLLARGISLIGIPMPAAPGMAHGFVAEIAFTGALALEAFAIGFTTTVCAGAYPAWRASRLAIVDALRRNR